MTSSPSDTDQIEQADQVERAEHPFQGFADDLAEAIGGQVEIAFDTVKIRVSPDRWLAAHQAARDEFGLVFFSFLSAIDWAKEVSVGDPPGDEDLEERIEVITSVSDLSEGKRVILSTDIATVGPVIDSLVDVYAGANWHEREAHEMFGIAFTGHPHLAPLYLPDAFEGNPLRKSFPLLSREVKPWPGKVDVEAMPEKPSTENPEG